MDNINNQEEYWDSIANKKEFTLPLQISQFMKYVSKEMYILDVGCGYGRTLNELHNFGYKNLYGVDFSKKMIERGLKLYPYLKLIKNSSGRLPFPDKHFDAVVLIAVLTCIVENNKQQKLIKEIQRVLKDKGILYIDDYLLNTDERNVKRYNEYEVMYGQYGIFKLPEGVVVRHHTKDYILKLIEKFKILIYDEMIYKTMNGNKSNGFYFIGSKK